MDARGLSVQIRNGGRHTDVLIAEALTGLQATLQSAQDTLLARVVALEGTADELTTDADLRGLTITGISAALTDPNDFGTRWWKVTVTYAAPVPLGDMTGVRIFVTDSASNEPDRGYQSYTAPGSGSAVAAFEPTAAARSVTVYLYPSTADGIYNESRGDSASISLGTVTNDTQGIERCANVTGVGVVAGAPEMDANGIYRQPLTVTFTAPSDPRWAKVQVVAKRTGPLYDWIGETATSGQRYLVNLPSSVQTWRVFLRSGDRSGRFNSLNEGPGGTLTPYVDVSVGSSSGAFNAGKIDTTTLASYLQIAAGVLGIADRGLTAEMVAQYTLTGNEIADLAINRAAIIGTGVILQAHIGDAQIVNAHIVDGTITSAKIASLQVDKISGWSGATILITSDVIFSGGGIQAQNLKATNGVYLNTDLILSASGGDTFVTATSLTGSAFVQGGAASFDSLNVGDDASVLENGNATFVDVNATGAYKVDGTQVVTNRQAAITAPSGGGTQDAEARTAIGSILSALQTHGLIAT